MTTQTEALKLARDEIAGLNGDLYYSGRFDEVLQEIDKALAQPEQEPVAWGWAIMHGDGTYAFIRPRIVDFFGSIQEREPYTSEDAKNADREWAGLAPHTIITLYTNPPQRKPLTREQIRKLAADNLSYLLEEYETCGVFNFVSEVEAAHGIKE